MSVAKPSVKVHFYARFNFEFTIFVVLIFTQNIKITLQIRKNLKTTFTSNQILENSAAYNIEQKHKT